MGSCFKMGSKGKNRDEAATNFMRNGEKLLEEMIASCGGKCNTIRCFSAKDLEMATNNFDDDHVIVNKVFFKLYRGIIGNRSIFVKKYQVWLSRDHEYSITDIVIGSQMSAHKNVLKVIGCCLESECPMVVYEHVGNYTLYDYIFATSSGNKGLRPLLWKCRIRVAMCIANAIAYLHTALRRPIVNRDIDPLNIVMDANNVPKLLDFSLSVCIPEGESHVDTEVLEGTYWFLAPEDAAYGRVNEKSDVFSFGVLLLMLLTGRRPLNHLTGKKLVNEVQKFVVKNRLKEILDPNIVAEESWSGEEEEIQEFCCLALRCVKKEAEDRPTMIEIGKELNQIHR